MARIRIWRPLKFALPPFSFFFGLSFMDSEGESLGNAGVVRYGAVVGEKDDSVDAESPLPSQKLIISAANPFVKHCLKLSHNSSIRRSHGSVIVMGATPIRFQESLQETNAGMDCLILSERVQIPEGLDEYSSCIARVSSKVLKRLSGLQSTESIDAISLMKIPTSFFSLEGNQNGDKLPEMVSKSTSDSSP
ncbi:tRNA/rRNA methyltransferase (SpoU) family protein [Quillaja saponaria]|uniref:tRNA/rRNA methyltransferase (SpoU) family protein n=1 Tax=Quillaja saponaria TaxID=32244 RepID=A0AAD7P665_QUISA|nr:tRNA/rRNA methyltransferase (SpoU) family protein [Quillaja saponaria]